MVLQGIKQFDVFIDFQELLAFNVLNNLQLILTYVISIFDRHFQIMQLIESP